MTLNKISLLLTLILGVCLFRLMAGPVLPEAAARTYLKQGATVIDVRTVEEYNAGHLTNVINIPLAELKTKLPAQVPDKSKILLLHCRSGRRSGEAETQLRTLGYTNAFSIGSFEQARALLTPTAP